MHRGATIPLPAHPTARHYSHRCHVAHCSSPFPACRLLVPRAAHQRRHHLHPRVPDVRHCEFVHLLHCARHSPRLSASHGSPGLSLPTDLPETPIYEEPLGCTLRRRQSRQHRLFGCRHPERETRQRAEFRGQPGDTVDQEDFDDEPAVHVTRSERLDVTARGTPPQQAPQSGQSATTERNRGPPHVATHHRRHVPHLCRWSPAV